VADDDSGDWECSAMMVLAEIGDVGRFRDPDALCSYAGLVPRVREWAGKRRAEVADRILRVAARGRGV